MKIRPLLLGLLVLAVLVDGVNCHHQANLDSDKPRLRGGGCGSKKAKDSPRQLSPAANHAKPAPASTKSTATGSVGTRTVGVAPAAQRKELLDELAVAGIKHNPAAIVGIEKIGGRIVFLEKGTSTAGLQHIVKEHGAQFAKRGIAEADIPEHCSLPYAVENVSAPNRGIVRSMSLPSRDRSRGWRSR